MEDNKDVMKMLEYLEEVKEAVRKGNVDTLLISACGNDKKILHASGNVITLFGLSELQHKRLNEEYEDKEQGRRIAKILASIENSDNKDKKQ